MNFSSLQTLMRLASLLSIAGSLSILVRFHRHQVLQQKEVNRIIRCIALCDLFFSLGTLIGRPHDGTPLCWLQSITTSYFSLVSIFWTTVIAYMLHQLVHHSVHLRCFHSYKVHCACWIPPLILTFAPLSTNTYGNPHDDSGWCFLDFRDGHESWTLNFWLFASYYAWIFSATAVYIYLLWSIFHRLSQVYQIFADAQNRSDSHIVSWKIQSSVKKLSWYPLIIIVCWVPSAIYDLREAFNSTEHRFSTEADYANLLPVFKGFLTALAFLSTTSRTVSREAKKNNTERKQRNALQVAVDEDMDDEEEDAGIDDAREALLPRSVDEINDRPSTASSQSLEYRDNNDMMRCSLPERHDSFDSF